jgi:hypothetical protein
MELPWEQETNTFFLVHKIPEASKGVTWADNTMEMSSSASEFTDDRSIDDIIEIKNKKTNSHKGKVVRWVRSHKCETIALVILVIGLILIPISVLAYLGTCSCRRVGNRATDVVSCSIAGCTRIDTRIDTHNCPGNYSYFYHVHHLTSSCCSPDSTRCNFDASSSTRRRTG